MTPVQSYRKRIQELFTYDFHIPYEWRYLHDVLACIPLIKNGTTLLTGTYGTGKTTLVEGYARRFFVDDQQVNIGKVRCHQELMDTDTLYRICFSDLDAPVKPRALLYQRFRYINELPRSNPAWQNAILSFFSEKEVSFRDQVFKVPDGINVLDRNPEDIGQEGVVKAVMDRIDQEIILPNHNYRPRDLPLLEPEPPLSSEQMLAIWRQIDEVQMDDAVWDYSHMLNHYFSACLRPRSIANKQFQLPCESCAHQAEVCHTLRSTPGQRPLNSLFKFAKALAWWQGRSQVAHEDVELLLPFTFAHRLDFHLEILREWPNPQEYLRLYVMGELLAAKKERWLEAIEAKQQKNYDQLLKIAGMADDLVIAWLYNQATHPELKPVL